LQKKLKEIDIKGASVKREISFEILLEEYKPCGKTFRIKRLGVESRAKVQNQTC